MKYFQKHVSHFCLFYGKTFPYNRCQIHFLPLDMFSLCLQTVIILFTVYLSLSTVNHTVLRMTDIKNNNNYYTKSYFYLTNAILKNFVCILHDSSIIAHNYYTNILTYLYNKKYNWICLIIANKIRYLITCINEI